MLLSYHFQLIQNLGLNRNNQQFIKLKISYRYINKYQFILFQSIKMERSQEKQPETFCKYCKKFIRTQNFMLHQGRCERQQQLRSSRVSSQSNKSQNKKNQFIYSNQKQREKQVPNQIYSSSFDKKQKNKIFDSNPFRSQRQNNRKKQLEQKIPCAFCGNQQTMEELDTHPNVCEHWEIQCQFCPSSFPKSLMDQHKAICSQNPRNIAPQRVHPHRHYGFQQQDQSQLQNNQPIPMIFRRRQREIYQPSSLMDMFFGRRMQQHQHHHQHQIDQSSQQSQPRLNIIQFSSQNGPQRIIFQSNSSQPANFIRLIQMLTNLQHPNQNPGLDQKQLKQLKRIKYLNKKPEPDTCTICFCEFQENQQLIELNCKHLYHQQCIFQWLKRVSTCPNCKKCIREGSENQNRRRQSPQRANPNREDRRQFGRFF